MPEFRVRTLPGERVVRTVRSGERVVRVVRVAGTSRVRTRLAGGGGGGGGGTGSSTTLDTTNFGGLLSALDDDVQKALDTLDDHVHRSVGWAVAAHAPVAVGAFGGTFDGDTLTLALAYSALGVVEGDAVLLSNQTSPLDNGIWLAIGNDEFARGEVIATLANDGKLVTAGLDVAANTSVIMQITGGALAYLYVTEAAVEAKVQEVVGNEIDTHDEDPAAHPDIWADIGTLTDDVAALAAADAANNRALWGAPADDIDALASTAYVMRCDGTSSWYTSTSTGLGDTPLGLDIRCKVRPRRPDNYPAQAFMEILTQINPANYGGDNFEAALVIGGTDADVALGHPLGEPFMFWEHTPDRTLFSPTVDGEVGVLADPADFVDGDPGPRDAGIPPTVGAGIVWGEWATLRWLLDTTTETLTMYREIGYGVELDGAWSAAANVSYTADGRAWYALESWTYPYAGSMEPGIEWTWNIGLRAPADFAWFEAYHGPDGTQLIDIQPSHITAAGLGGQSIIDGTAEEWIGDGGCVVARLNPVPITSGVVVIEASQDAGDVPSDTPPGSVILRRRAP